MQNWQIILLTLASFALIGALVLHFYRPQPVPTTGLATGHRKIPRLSPKRIRQLGAEYRVWLTGLTDMTAGIWAFLIVGGLIVIWLASKIAFQAVPYLFPAYGYSLYGQLVVFVGLLAAPFIRLRYFLILLPPYTLAQANNVLTGRLHTFTKARVTGKLPWMILTDKDYIDARVIIVDGVTVFLTKDGVPLTFAWTVQLRLNDQLLGLNLRNTLEGLAKGLADVVENALTKNLLNKTAEEVRDPTVVREVEKQIRDELNAPLPEDPGGAETITTDVEENPIWVRFGIVSELITLGEPKFDSDYQQALTAQAIADIIKKTAKKFRDEIEGLPADVAMNSALIINKEDVKRQAVAFEGLEPVVGRAIESIMRVWRPTERGGES